MSATAPEQGHAMGRAGWLLLIGLTAVAFAVRFYRLEQVPPGLHYDEAFDALDASRLLTLPIWRWPVFFTGNFGREPLAIYLQAAAQVVGGPSIAAARAVSAAAGALFTPALAWLAWELAPGLAIQERRRFALWTGTAALGLLWGQIFARYGIRLSLFVLVQVLLWASLWRAWRKADNGFWWALAGAWGGLSFYTYLPARLLPLVAILLLVLAAFRRRAALRRRLPGLALALLVAGVVAGPLAAYFIRNPLSFFTRVEQVSIVSRGGAAALLDNAWAVLGMFLGRGDPGPRANLPYRPLLDLWMAGPFLVGVLLSLRRVRQPAPLFLLAGLGVMLLPTLLSEYAPHFQRSIGALPFVALLAAWGLAWLAAWAPRRWPRGRAVYGALGWALLAASLVTTARVYFVQWATSPDLFAAWDVGFTQLAAQVAASDERVYMTPRGSQHPTVTYLLQAHPDAPTPEGFDGRACVRLATGTAARYYVLSGEDARGPLLLASYLPDSTTEVAVRDGWGAPWATLIRQPDGGAVQFPEMTAFPVPFSDGIGLLGYWLSLPELTAGERLYVRLFWQVSATPSHSYTAFVHLLRVDAAGAASSLAGADAPPGHGACPTAEWLPGEVVVDEVEFVLPDDLPAADGAYYLEVGFYTPEDGRRLDVPGQAEGRALIGPLRLAP